jgi:hypothetical protein
MVGDRAQNNDMHDVTILPDKAVHSGTQSSVIQLQQSSACTSVRRTISQVIFR